MKTILVFTVRCAGAARHSGPHDYSKGGCRPVFDELSGLEDATMDEKDDRSDSRQTDISTALALLGCEGVDADLVAEIQKWVRTMDEVRRILCADDGEDVREAARRAMRREADRGPLPPGLHEQIKAACAEAAPAIARAANGSEASIYNLRYVFADLTAVLVRDGAIVGALKAKGITATVEGPRVSKHA